MWHECVHYLHPLLGIIHEGLSAICDCVHLGERPDVELLFELVCNGTEATPGALNRGDVATKGWRQDTLTIYITGITHKCFESRELKKCVHLIWPLTHTLRTQTRHWLDAANRSLPCKHSKNVLWILSKEWTTLLLRHSRRQDCRDSLMREV